MIYQTYEDLLARYTYRVDKHAFADARSRRLVPESVVRAKLVALVGPERAESTIQTLKSVPVPPPPARALNPAAQKIILLNSTYDEISDQIDLYKRPDNATVVLYKKLANAEVRQVGTLQHDTFRSLAKADARFQSTLRAAYELNQEAFQACGFDFSAFVDKMGERFEMDASRILEIDPPQISWNPSVPSFKQFNPALLVPGPAPAWSEFTSRLDFPETFKAWVWSIFVPENRMRQVLWIRGGGYDGKSVVLEVLGDYYEGERVSQGSANVATFDTANFETDSFSLSSVVNRRLCLFGEVKYAGILQHSKIKNITGGDKMEVNEKYEKKYTAKMYSKFLMCSQLFPQIDLTDFSHVSRLLLLQVSRNKDVKDQGDNTWKDRLTAEMPAFLHSCRESYSAQCPTGEQLLVPEAMSTEIQTHCGSLDTELVRKFISNKLVLKPEYYITRLALYQCLTTFFSTQEMANQKYNNLRYQTLVRLLTTVHGARPLNMDEGQTGLMGVTIRDK